MVVPPLSPRQQSKINIFVLLASVGQFVEMKKLIILLYSTSTKSEGSQKSFFIDRVHVIGPKGFSVTYMGENDKSKDVVGL